MTYSTKLGARSSTKDVLGSTDLSGTIALF